MNNYDANPRAGVNKRLKRWQRAFITLYAYKINWQDSDHQRISISRGNRQYYLYRQDNPAVWVYSMQVLDK